MKFKHFFLVGISILLINCNSKTNSSEFIETNSGRYLFNSNEIIEVYFINSELYLKWHGANKIKPLMVDENTFYVKEMNEKIQFKNNPENNTNYIVLIPKNENEALQYNFKKLNEDEKTPNEYLLNNEFDKAVEAYKLIKLNDSLDPFIEEAYINRIGYKEVNKKDYKKAMDLFKINIVLYPESSNVYDSYADALKRSGDTIQAIEYYKKSLSIDSGNSYAKQFIEKYNQK